MKNSVQKSSKNKVENFQITEYRFYWIFDGNGSWIQKHDEMDYGRFIENNYESKSNLYL